MRANLALDLNLQIAQDALLVNYLRTHSKSSVNVIKCKCSLPENLRWEEDPWPISDAQMMSN